MVKKKKVNGWRRVERILENWVSLFFLVGLCVIVILSLDLIRAQLNINYGNPFSIDFLH